VNSTASELRNHIVGADVYPVTHLKAIIEEREMVIPVMAPGKAHQLTLIKSPQAFAAMSKKFNNPFPAHTVEPGYLTGVASIQKLAFYRDMWYLNYGWCVQKLRNHQ
jgi:hypothetical protein